MYYTVYKTTNKINGKCYIGTHKTTDLEDDYLGSGKYLKRAIEKHGVENFSKEILSVFNNPEEMFDREKELVTEEFLTESNTYNLKVGGEGGFDYINKDVPFRQAKNRKAAGAMHHYWRNEEFRDKMSAIASERALRMHRLGRYDHINHATFKGRTHSEETKRAIGEANKSLTADKNSQYGSFWVTDGKKNLKMKSGAQIPEGFIRGRKISGA